MNDNTSVIYIPTKIVSKLSQILPALTNRVPLSNWRDDEGIY